MRHAGEGAEIVTVSSGASPSGRVHLGNLREFLTVHFVAEELRRRGLNTRHLHVWDDYDRFRKVPVGVDPSWSEHIGRPLSKVPDPEGCHDSWAAHFKQPLHDALHAMGVDMDEVSQTERYEAGHYKDAVLTAVAARDAIEAVLARHRTKAAAPEPENEQEAAALAESVVSDDDEPVGAGDLARFPYKPYCRDCGRDTVTLTSYDDETTELAYTCDFNGYSGSTTCPPTSRGSWSGRSTGRCAGPSSTSTSSRPGWTTRRPARRSPSGTSSSRTSSACRGRRGSATGSWGSPASRRCRRRRAAPRPPRTRCRILEAPILRWLYVRRNPRQTFNIDFGAEVVRLYDEWDALGRKAADPARRDAQVLAFERAVRHRHRRASCPRPPTSCRSGCSPRSPTSPPATPGPDQSHRRRRPPRGPRAAAQPGHELDARLRPGRTAPRSATAPDVDAARRADRGRAPLAGPAARPPAGRRWSWSPTTALVYGVPKLARGMGLDDAPTDQVKADQKAFFKLLYNLLVDADRGPRLPTLFVALGSERVRELLTPPARLTARAARVSSSTAVLPSRRTSSTHSPPTPAPFSWVTSTIPAPRPGRL